MSDEPISEQPIDNPYETLKAEMQSQYMALKDSFEQSNREKDELIAQLKEQNENLNRALLRSAFTTPVQTEPVKTEEQLYQDRISDILNKAKQFSKYR